MKKIIVTALTFLLGALGYTVVDVSLEQRVIDLENKVILLEEAVESYHDIQTTIKEIIVPTKRTTTSRQHTTLPPSHESTIVTTSKKDFLGYKYDQRDFYYVDDKECWQENCTYDYVYNNIAPSVAMFTDRINARFAYEDKEWLIQLCKGQYGFLFVGGEVGVFTAPLGTYYNSDFSAPDKSDRLSMQLDIYWSKNNDGHYLKVITRDYDNYWWANGVVKGQLTEYTAPATELKMKNRITFKSKEMADLFVNELKKTGFMRAVGSDQLANDSYYQNGADVYLLWSTVYNDAVIGGDAVTTTTTSVYTTAPATIQRPTTTIPNTTETTWVYENTSVSE